VAVPPSPSPLTQPEERDRAEIESKAMLTQNSLALEAQVEERPLAKKQEELQGIPIRSKNCSYNDTSTDTEHIVAPTGNVDPEHPRKALLKNDDVELRRVGTVSN
jgi:RNA polymerase II subunit A-like phosphatase